MRFTYKPEGVEPKVWDYKPEKLMNVEAEEIERLTGMTYGEFKDALTKESMRATRALLFVFLKREQPTLKFDQVAFSQSEVALDFDEQEKAALRDEILAKIKSGAIDADEAQPALEALAAELGEPEPEPAESVEDPKDEPARTSDASGSGPSPSISVVPQVSGTA